MSDKESTVKANNSPGFQGFDGKSQKGAGAISILTFLTVVGVIRAFAMPEDALRAGKDFAEQDKEFNFNSER